MNLIYQCWTGPLCRGALASKRNIEQYANRIGAEYLFEHNPNIASRTCDIPIYYECLNPLLEDRFLLYDAIAVLDMDIFAVDGLTDDIFTSEVNHIGVCAEEFQPKHRTTLKNGICSANDEKWADIVSSAWGVTPPRTAEGLLKVYNSGVILFSAEGLHKAREYFIPFQEYISTLRKHKLDRFYLLDQNYLHTMLLMPGINYIELDTSWNCQVHFLGPPHLRVRPINDMRGNNPRFVHIQLRGADHFSPEKLRRITNLPVSQWDLFSA